MLEIKQFKMWLSNGDISEEAYNYLAGISSKEILGVSEVDEYKEKKISITISTYNRPNMLIRLMDSIIMQVYSNYEIIIIDDKSTDDTETVINKYIASHPKIKIEYYINETNMGVSESKKRGYELCQGDIIIFSDDDDFFIDRLYFRKLNRIYTENEECTMTTASTLFHYEKDDTYSIAKLNFLEPIDNKEYLKGFASKYRKPGSMFTLSLNARKMKEIHYENLMCFNDMSLYMYGALAKGNVYPIVEAVGVYSVQVFSMTSGVSAIYTINNLDAKIDIGIKALKKNYLKKEEYKTWKFNQCMPTLLNFFNGNIKSGKDIVLVNRWIIRNLSLKYALVAYFKEMNARFLYYIGRYCK